MSTTPRRKSTRKQDATISISEFKQWLSGVEDMQENGWVPDAAQWAKIRSKIDLIVEDEVVEAATVMPQGPIYRDPVMHMPVPGGGYSALVDQSQQYQQAPRPYQHSNLDDSIMIPQKTQLDVAMDSGLVHNNDQFS